MFIAMVKPYEDPTIADVLVVEHTQYPHTKTVKDFEMDWESALAEVKKASPDEWQVSQVYKEMEEKEWQFILVENTTVEY